MFATNQQTAKLSEPCIGPARVGQKMKASQQNLFLRNHLAGIALHVTLMAGSNASVPRLNGITRVPRLPVLIR